MKHRERGHDGSQQRIEYLTTKKNAVDRLLHFSVDNTKETCGGVHIFHIDTYLPPPTTSGAAPFESTMYHAMPPSPLPGRSNERTLG